MIKYLNDFSFEECQKIVENSIKNGEDYLNRIYEICDKFDNLFHYIVKQIEDNNSDYIMSKIDVINTIRINQILPFFILEDKYEDMQIFANAWILILNNLIKMTGDKNKILESSTYAVSKLLKIEENFSRLIYMSELLLNCYEHNKEKELNREDYQLSKMYIDKIIGNNEDKDK